MVLFPCDPSATALPHSVTGGSRIASSSRLFRHLHHPLVPALLAAVLRLDGRFLASADSIRGGLPQSRVSSKYYNLASNVVKGKVKGDSHRIWTTQRAQVNVASLRLFLRSSTGPNRAFEPQSLGRVRDPVRIAERSTAIDAATQRRHFGFRLRLVDKLQPIGGGKDGAAHSLVPGKSGWPPMSCQPSSSSNRPR